MSKVLVTEDYLADIADAIREKLGVQTQYKPSEMAAAIMSISGGESMVFSLDETEAGTWIDGSTLYKKTIDCGALPDSTLKQVAHGISNIGQVVSISGTSQNSTSGTKIPMPYVGRDNDPIGIYADGTNVNIRTWNNVTAYNVTYITLYYTKTA